MEGLPLKRTKSGHDDIEMFVFSSGGILFGVDISEVKEILGVPGEEDQLKRLEALIPTFSVSSLVGFSEDRLEGEKIILSIVDGSPYNFLVDGIRGVVRLGEGQIRRFPELVEANAASRALLGIFLKGDEIVFLLSLARLVREHDPS